MRDNKLHTPVGVRDILEQECAVKKEISKRVEKVFRCYGYCEVESPTFEYIEVFSDEKRGSTNPRFMYKFFDRDGSTLALRSDITPPIARIAATAYAKKHIPLRFCYFGNAFRYNENYQGKMREFSQAGVELMGVNSIEADAEIISIAVNGLLSIGITDFKITIGDVAFFKGILEETGLPQEICKQLQNKIAMRDYVAAEEIVTKNHMPENIRKIFIELPKLVGCLDVLAYVKKLSKNNQVRRALSRLQDLFQVLKAYHIEQYVTFDLGMINQLNYYTGIIFRGYTYGSGYSIVDGGRYDNLVGQYGVEMPAVGFALKLSEIVSIVTRSKINIPVKTAETLVSYTQAGMTTAIDTANTYRRSGMYVETSLLGEDIEKNIRYAQSKNMTHVLYFIDNIHLKVISLADEIGGFTVDITIDELVMPKEEQ